MSKFDKLIEIVESKDEEEQHFDPPHRSEWVLGVDENQVIFVIQTPNIHYGFTDGCTSTYEYGIPYDVPDVINPGVYKVKCNYWVREDNGLTGDGDEWGFEPDWNTAETIYEA